MAEILCGVCNSEPKKYKCPTCALPYCSIACFKEHKVAHPEPGPASSTRPTDPEIPQPPPPEPVPKYLRKRIDFSVLATNPRFQQLLKAYPALLPALQRVYASTIEPDPDSNPNPRSNFRGRGGFRGRGRGRGGRDYGPPRWTPKKGEDDAMRLLKGFREGKQSDEDKEAMAAFVQLVEETFDENAKKESTRGEPMDTGTL